MAKIDAILKEDSKSELAKENGAAPAGSDVKADAKAAEKSTTKKAKEALQDRPRAFCEDGNEVIAPEIQFDDFAKVDLRVAQNSAKARARRRCQEAA